MYKTHATKTTKQQNKLLIVIFIPTGSVEEAPLLKLKEEKMDAEVTEPHIPPFASSIAAATAAASSPNQAADRASLPSSSLPFTSVVIKQEPQSPVHVSAEQDAVDSADHFAHSTTLELPGAPAADSLPGNTQPGGCFIPHTVNLLSSYLCLINAAILFF